MRECTTAECASQMGLPPCLVTRGVKPSICCIRGFPTAAVYPIITEVDESLQMQSVACLSLLSSVFWTVEMLDAKSMISYRMVVHKLSRGRGHGGILMKGEEECTNVMLLHTHSTSCFPAFFQFFQTWRNWENAGKQLVFPLRTMTSE